MTKSVSMTIVSNMSANYGESLGNTSVIQKKMFNGRSYAARSRESIKSSLLAQAGFDENLKVTGTVATPYVGEDHTLADCASLESGYVLAIKSKDGCTYTKESSIYVSSAISSEPFIAQTEFHNNLKLATTRAKAEHLNVQSDAGKVGLMPYNYEYSKDLKIYSITIDLEKFGIDENFNVNISNEEKKKRLFALLDAIEHLELKVRGSLDNAEPLFIVGGLSPRKCHVFENLVKLSNGELILGETFEKRVEDGNYHIGMVDNIFKNEKEIRNKMHIMTIEEFFEIIKQEILEFYA